MAKILIIEDEFDTAKMLERRVQDWGHEAVVAYDSDGGKYLAKKENPNLILLDLMLPPWGGEAVLAAIRTDEDIKNTPIIILTGVDDDECKITIERMGVTDYFLKPYDPEALHNAIELALK